MASKRRRKQKQAQVEQTSNLMVPQAHPLKSSPPPEPSQSEVALQLQNPHTSNADTIDSAGALPFAGSKDQGMSSAFEDLTDKSSAQSVAGSTDALPTLEVLSRRGQFQIVDIPQLKQEQALINEMTGLFDALESKATPTPLASREQANPTVAEHSVIAVLPTSSAQTASSPSDSSEEWFDESAHSSIEETFQTSYEFPAQPDEASVLLSRSGRRRRRSERTIVASMAHISDGSTKVISGSVPVQSPVTPRIASTQEVPKIIVSPDSRKERAALATLAQTTQTPVLPTVSSKDVHKRRAVKPIHPEKRRSGMLLLWSTLALAAIALAIFWPISQDQHTRAPHAVSKLGKPQVPATPVSLHPTARSLAPTQVAEVQVGSAPSAVQAERELKAVAGTAEQAAPVAPEKPIDPETMALVMKLMENTDEADAPSNVVPVAQELPKLADNSAAKTEAGKSSDTPNLNQVVRTQRDTYAHVPPAAQMKAPYAEVPPLSSSDTEALAEYLTKRGAYDNTPPKSSQEYLASNLSEKLSTRQLQARYASVPPRSSQQPTSLEVTTVEPIQPTSNTVAVEPRHYIQTQPSGVGVYVNGKRRGFTPFALEVEKETEVTLLHPDYLPSKVTLHPHRGSRLHHLSMTPR